jgi:galactose mutarotase-like enzyme
VTGAPGAPGASRDAHESLTLAAGGTRVEIVPALGGKIASLHLAGREWLWTSDVLPRVAPTEAVAADDAASYVRVADTGGFDECLPTVGAATVPAGVPAFGGLALPDHGELWSQRAPTESLERERAAVTRWAGRRMPYTLARTVRVHDDGAVQMDYALANVGDAPIPFLWSSHPLLPLTADTRLDLPARARVRVWAQHGVDLGGERAEHRWPTVRADGRDVDFSAPGALRPGWACKLFLDLADAGERATLAIEQGGARLGVTVATADVTHFGLWLNHGGWTPFDGGAPYTNLAFEPCIGAPDPLDAALGAWDAAAWLAPRATRAWTLVWRGSATGAR